MDELPVKNAIISVYDKTNLDILINYLNNQDCYYNIWTSGGTFNYINSNKLSNYLCKISDLTEFPEILGGRVKTLHPKVYGGLLADSDKLEHVADMNNNNLIMFDLVVVNLYPFKQVTSQEHSEEEAIENIDIGGVSLIRAGAKNYKHISVLTNPEQYNDYINTNNTIEYRKKLATGAFKYIASYDMDIGMYFDNNTIYRTFTKKIPLKYGLNPYQENANILSIDNNELPFTILNGKPGYINVIDAVQSWKLVCEVKNVVGYEAVTSFKHTTPTGLAINYGITDYEQNYFSVNEYTSSLAITFLRARNIDPLSSFGDFVAISGIVDVETAKCISSQVSDGIIALGYDEMALDILKKKKSGKYIILQGEINDTLTVEYKEYNGLCLSSNKNNAIISDTWFTNIPTNNKEFSNMNKTDLMLANILLKYTPSNSVAFSYNGQVLGVGAGQQNRVDCVRLAGNKMKTWFLRHHPDVLELRQQLKREGVKKQDIINSEYNLINTGLLKDKGKFLQQKINHICLASDGFFPFSDNIDVANEYGVKYIIQPGGSIRDDIVIQSCNKYDILMVLTDKRMFYH
jgi:phosphoribosylaminoimidazolecarboxamide formyltransferase / IMP cyclohydrolase